MADALSREPVQRALTCTAMRVGQNSADRAMIARKRSIGASYLKTYKSE